MRPPTSGPGSGVAAWREYAAAVTKTAVESWAALSREEIVELLDTEGTGATADSPSVDSPDGLPDAEVEADRDAAAPRAEPASRVRPVWMVPTADGFVPEHTLRRR